MFRYFFGNYEWFGAASRLGKFTWQVFQNKLCNTWINCTLLLTFECTINKLSWLLNFTMENIFMTRSIIVCLISYIILFFRILVHYFPINSLQIKKKEGIYLYDIDWYKYSLLFINYCNDSNKRLRRILNISTFQGSFIRGVHLREGEFIKTFDFFGGCI